MNNRIFISFAIEDAFYRTGLSNQAKDERSPFSFTDMSVKEAWDTQWKTKCRTKIKGCDGMIVLLSKNIKNADGALWEIECAKEENIPLIGLYIHTDDHYYPNEMLGINKVSWTWSNISKFLDSL
jgi:hypothetical protein